MAIINIGETVAKSRTLGGCPCILVERKTPNASGKPSESWTLGVFADNELGNALADELIEQINRNKVKV